MLKQLSIFLFLAATTLSGGAVEPVAEPDPVILKIQSMLAKPPVLCGHFEQTKFLIGMKKMLASNGRFCVVTDKGILWRTLQPFPNTLRLTRDEIVNFQGERVAMRLDAKQEPVVRMINSVLFSLLAGDLAQLNQHFDVDAKAGESGWQVALKAREPALAKTIGAIRLSGGEYVQTIHINEAGGDRTRIGFSEIQTGESAMLAEEAALF